MGLMIRTSSKDRATDEPPKSSRENSPLDPGLAPKAALATHDQQAQSEIYSIKPKVMRRAARACLACRVRKVRCDVVDSSPCRNCKWDDVECIVRGRRRKRANRDSADASCPSVGSAGTVNAQSLQIETIQSTTAAAETHKEDSSRLLEPLSAANCGNSAEIDMMTPSTISSSIFEEEDICVESPEAPFLDMTPSRPPPFESPTSLPCIAPCRQPHSLNQLLSSLANAIKRPPERNIGKQEPLQVGQGILASLPNYIKAPSGYVDQQTLLFLSSSGALDLPSRLSQLSLLKSFAQGVQSNMPLVDIHEIVRTVTTTSYDDPVSLLLYQSIMFAGSIFIPHEDLKNMGYATRSIAMEVLFRRAKILYSMEYDTDPMTVIQTLLLFSLHSPGSSSQQRPSCWIDLAIGIARKEKLHREATRADFPTSLSKIWKRLWWCCVVRDTFDALGGCCPPRIRHDEFDTSFLELDDFNVITLGDAGFRKIYLHSVEEQTHVAEVFIELGKLSLLLGRALSYQYRLSGQESFSHTGLEDPVMGSSKAQEVGDLSAALDTWHQNLPSSCQPEHPLVMLQKSKPSLVDVNRSILHITYHTAVLTLNGEARPYHGVGAEHGLRNGFSSSSKSANCVLQLVAGLVTCGLDDLVPVTVVSLLLPALIVYSLNTSTHQTNDETVRDAQQSIQLLERMRDRFSCTDIVARYLQPLHDAVYRRSSKADNQPMHERYLECSYHGANHYPSPGGACLHTFHQHRGPLSPLEVSNLDTSSASNLPEFQDDLGISLTICELSSTKSPSYQAISPFLSPQPPEFAAWYALSPELINLSDISCLSAISDSKGGGDVLMGNSWEDNHGELDEVTF